MFPQLTVGAHLHAVPDLALQKISAAYQAGCRRFDTAIQGYGGCPMAKDELVGNLPTEKLITFLNKEQLIHPLDPLAFESASNLCKEILGGALERR